mgnify:FL=1
MPEIKNSFVRGRMNLDLDERLIPSGEYREALNIQVSTSEDSDVGSVQNVPGNQEIANFDELGVIGELICIGSISDEKNNRLYWFVVDTNDGIAVRSAIIEYNVDLQLTTPIVVDIDNTFLEFSVNNYITGINIVDDFLFFTDGITEPKKINIEQFRKNNHTDISINSDFFVFDENKGPTTKEQITVIKQKPTKPPVIELTRTNPSFSTYKNVEITMRPTNLFTLEPGLSYDVNSQANTAPVIEFELPMETIVNAGANIPGGSYTDLANNTYTGGPYNYMIRDAQFGVLVSVGQTLLLSDVLSTGSLPNNAQVKIIIDQIKYVGGLNVSALPGLPNAVPVTDPIYARLGYTVVSVDPPLPAVDTVYDYLVEDFSRILFERGFPRFSYRYKYQDGEYSAFGPFTEVAFETGSFNIHPTREPYNSAMENNISQILLKQFVTYDIPKGVVEIDLLYKPENSTTVYSLDTIKPYLLSGDPNPAWTTVNNSNSNILLQNSTEQASDTGYYVLDTDVIYAALPENQLLRPYDNVPKKAKSQDFTANRLIYGNYIQNLNLNDYDNNLAVRYADRREYYGLKENERGSKQSVKSQRTYQVGISFLDLYGRETPVFSSGNTGSLIIPYDDNITSVFLGNASRSLQLVVNNIPKIEHVYQTVKVTGVNHSGGSVGQYFFFEISDMNNLLAQEYNNFSVHNIKQYRAGQLIYEGPVRIWNQESVNSGSASPSGGTTKGHGRYEPFSSSSPGDWLVDDVVTIETDAKFFKIFVKETASEYYNLVLDRVYRAEDDGNLWLSFPSSDRNKLKEDDFIILKKSINADVQVEDENKFKVIDISNEAPEFIRSKYKTLGTFDGSGNLSNLYPDTGLQPREGSPKLVISKDGILNQNAEDLQNLFDNGISLSIKFQKDFNNGIVNSKRYDIVSMDTVNSSPEIYRITLDRQIEEQDSWVETSVGVLEPTLKTTIRLEINKNWEEFQGRFFVKILSNITTAQHLETLISSEFQQVFTARPEIFALIDTGLFQGAGNPPASVVTSNGLTSNYEQTTTTNLSSNGKTDTQAEWQTALGFGTGSTTSRWFIDEMYFAAHQPTIKNPDFTSNVYSNPGQYNHFIPANGDYQFDVSGSGSLLNAKPPGGSDLITSTASYSDIGGGVEFFDFGVENDNVYSFDGGIIDGFEGVFQANQTYNNYTGGPKAPRAWKSQLGQGWDSSGNAVYGEEVYGSQNSTGFFMHLSYSKVGVDLWKGDSDDLNAGGAINSWYYGDTNIVSNDGSENVTEYDSSAKIDLQGIQNNNTQGGYARMVCNVPQAQPSPLELEKREAQWDPVGTASLGNYSASNEQFINQLSSGNQFTFANDTSGEIFTILDVHVKRIYNHTAWNRKMKWDADNSVFIEDRSTVHYAWHRFAQASEANPSSNSNVQDRFDDLADVIKRFGAADNRRVCYIIRLDKDPQALLSNPEALAFGDSDFMQFFKPYIAENESEISQNPAVFETEPKEDLDLDIYYEATQAYPLELDNEDNRYGYLSGSVGDRVTVDYDIFNYPYVSPLTGLTLLNNRIKSWDGDTITLDTGFLSQAIGGADPSDEVDQAALLVGSIIKIHKKDYSYVSYKIKDVVTVSQYANSAQNEFYITQIQLFPDIVEVGLSYFNCFSFGNGVESNRIRDDFNQQFIKNGVKASTTLQEQYLQDRRTSGLIFSGLYNKNTSLNDLNQFIMAEKITKELEPTYGSIQKLFARDSDLIALCEDKIVQIFADKDAIFNADGNPQLVASNRVLGQSRPFVGEYGISKNPETFASSSYRAYFADKQRGAVLRLSMDGLTPISDAGMKDWFRDKLKGNYFNIVGSYDTNKDHYNITFDSGNNFNSTDNFKDEDSSVTVSYKESVKGWVSFKGFIQESGVSCVNTYFTIRNGNLYAHDNILNLPVFMYNEFYGDGQNSYITSVFNNSSTTVKHFNTLNYDGQQGWVCDFFNTDLHDDGQTLGDFINKENKYFATIFNSGSISGVEDTSSFGFQGIGIADSIQINI